MDHSGNLLFANKWLTDYTDLSMDQINATRWTGVMVEEDCAAAAANIAKLSAGNFTRTIEHRIREASSGMYRWHTGTITPVLSDKGEALYWSVYMADINAQKEIEAMLKDNRELRETKALLEEKLTALDVSNKQLEQFAYVASHDLQEPLRKIISFSDYLTKQFSPQLGDDGKNVLMRMANATGRMKALITDVLEYSTISETNEDWEPIDLNDLAQDALQQLETALEENKPLLTIATLPAITGSRTQLRQVFVNILSNALKYRAPTRQLELNVSAELQDKHILLHFNDNGIGFENQYVAKMFGLFERLHTNDKYSGTGIGLAICKKIVELHNGNISATGTPDIGATFTISLPIRNV
jgi:PAS domain S-box-containing protein